MRRLKSLQKKEKKETGPSRSEEALSEFVRVVVLERERPLCPTHTSYCILDAYGRWEFVITPTSGRRTNDSRIAETRILRNPKTLKCDRASTIVCVKKKKKSVRTLRKMIHSVNRIIKVYAAYFKIIEFVCGIIIIIIIIQDVNFIPNSNIFRIYELILNFLIVEKLKNFWINTQFTMFQFLKAIVNSILIRTFFNFSTIKKLRIKS